MSDTNVLLTMTADIAKGYLANNSVPIAEIGRVVSAIHESLNDIANGKPTQVVEEVAKLVPAVAVKKSITEDHLICLEDGRKFKSLKRHLATLNMTPEQYRLKWSLPPDYPMVAPGYAKKRSALAKASGLGNSRKTA